MSTTPEGREDETGRFRLRDPATWPDHDLRRFPQDPAAQQPWEDRLAWYLRRRRERGDTGTTP